MKKLILLSLILCSKMSYGQWNSFNSWIWSTYGHQVSVGYADDVFLNTTDKLIVGGDLAIYDGAFIFRDFENGPLHRRILGNSMEKSTFLHSNTQLNNGSSIRMWGFTDPDNDNSAAISFYAPLGTANTGGRTAFEFNTITSYNAPSGSNFDKNLLYMTYEGDAYFHKSVNAPNGKFTTSLTVSSLASSSNKLAVFSPSGTIMTYNLPTLSISGNTLNLLSGPSGATVLSSVSLPTYADNLSLSGNVLTLRKGSTTLNSVTLPSGADNLGNHTATTNLNLSSFSINNCNSIATDQIIFAPTQELFLSGGFLRTSMGLGLEVAGTSPGGVNNERFFVNGGAQVQGDLKVNGVIFGTLSGSDKRIKEHIEHIDGTLEKLSALNVYRYKYRKIPEHVFDENLHFGFIAQEVQEIFPNLVGTIDSQGYLGVNYQEFIPLLLSAIKEQDKKLDALQRRINELESKSLDKDRTLSDKKDEKGTRTAQAENQLYQNVPNPFSRETRIRFSIGESYENAFIGIYDLNGRQLSKITIQHGSEEIIISGNNFQPGMYVYSLVVDGELIDSKKMVISE